jgi:MFS family permease
VAATTVSGHPVVAAAVPAAVRQASACSASMGTMPAMLAELFPVEVRYTGVSTCYQVAMLIGSGLGPLVAATLAAIAAGGTGLIAGYVVLTCVISLLGLAGIPETAHRRTDPVEGATPSAPASSTVITGRGAE